VLNRKRLGVRWLGIACLIAIGSNFAWEMAQAYLYEPMGTVWQATRRCVIASVGDGAMVLLVLAAARSLASRTSVQYAVTASLGVVVAIALEWWGLGTGRWVYRADMSTIPGTGVGLVPVFQMALLSPLTLWVADRSIVGSERVPHPIPHRQL
jgi:hypothetical protein